MCPGRRHRSIFRSMQRRQCSQGECTIMTNSQAWGYAIGMIKVDGLEPTEDFKKYSR